MLPITGSIYYEELACVGYHPQQQQLEAVVYVYQPTEPHRESRRPVGLSQTGIV